MDLPETERLLPPPDRQPIFEAAGYHGYVESEFPEGAGHCSICGGGPAAAIHNHVEPMERVAVALESIVDLLKQQNMALSIFVEAFSSCTFIDSKGKVLALEVQVRNVNDWNFHR